MLASLPAEILRAIRLTIVVAVVTGLAYPLAITGIAQLVFHDKANGSLISENGQLVGSSLIGQQFTTTDYFQGRPSATLNPTTNQPSPYQADNSGGSNLAPSNQALIDRVSASVDQIRRSDYLGPQDQVPVDLVTTDFSGFDPDITVAAANIQVHRVAGSRGLDESKVRALVDRHTHGRDLGIFGEPYVNVLELNLALDHGEAK